MAFTLDRNEAAQRLGVSTRTIDRHIQNNRIRTRRVGKKLFLEENDVEIIRLEETPSQPSDDYVVILNEEPLESDTNTEIIPSYQKSKEISTDAKMAITELSKFYSEAQNAIAQKDEVIKDLSYKLGKAETELKNSVHIQEYHRTTHLLEATKRETEANHKNFSDKIVSLEKEVNKKNSFIIAMVILFILVIIATFVFLIFNRL